jgi:hypothetical protein
MIQNYKNKKCKKLYTNEYIELSKTLKKLDPCFYYNFDLDKQTCEITYYEVDGKTGYKLDEYLKDNNLLDLRLLPDHKREQFIKKKTIFIPKVKCSCCSN